MNPLKIMIVEDERLTAESVKCTLEDLGYEVCAIAATGTDAVKQAAVALPDLVLMDIVLRGPMDGIEAAEQIRAAHGIPIVFATAYADDPVLCRAKVTDPYGYIVKPFTARELYSTIEIAIHKNRLDRRIERLNAVLVTVRRVSQLIIREDNKERLLEGVCNLLVAHRGYTSAWVAAFGDGDDAICIRQAGMTDKQFRALLDRTEVRDYPKCVRTALAQPGTVLITQEQHGCPDCPLGRQPPCEQMLVARLGHGGKAPGWLCAGVPVSLVVDDVERHLFGEVADDISVALHAINAEALRERSEHALRRAQKMDVLGQLAAGIAHDFNNSLTAIYGHTDLLDAILDTDSQARDSLRAVRSAAEQAAGVTRALLAFSHGMPAQKRHVDVHKAVAKSLRLLSRLIPTMIEVHADLPGPGKALAFSDETQLEQIVMNLSLNACDAMPDGGSLAISVEHRGDPPDQIVLRTPPEHGVVVVTVSDTGTGMTPEIRERIFEPFFTTKPRGSGTGLGLAIVHGIVKDHGGEIRVKSTPGQGSTFTIVLPAIAAGASEDETERVADVLPHVQRELVVLADDDRQIREVVAHFLRSCGFVVAQVGDGHELVRFCEQSRREAAVLLVDHEMPKLNGLRALVQIRALGNTTPAILATGHVSRELESQLDPHTTLLRKPFGLTDLARELATLTKRDTTDSNPPGYEPVGKE